MNRSETRTTLIQSRCMPFKMKKPTLILLSLLSVVVLTCAWLWGEGTEAYGISDKKKNILSQTYPTNKWVADIAHSSLRFSTSHFVVYDLVGRFDDFEIVMYTDERDFTDAVIEGTVKIGSANMPNPSMAGNIKGPDYLDVKQYPEATFKSTAIHKTGNDTYEITGDLTIKGMTMTISLNAQFGGYIWGGGGCGFKVKGSIKRKDFGIGKGEPFEFEGIGPAIGFDVDFELNLRLELQ